jgi:ABC-type lipoprotein release transport system permease subunit
MIRSRLGTSRIRLFYLALLFLIIITHFIVPSVKADSSILTGVITDNVSGETIADAEVNVLYRRYSRYRSSRWYGHSSTTSDSQGLYTLNLDTDGNYLILVSHLDFNGEHDYVPYAFFHNPTAEEVELDIQLWASSIIKFDGLAYFIETTAIPETTFRITEPNSTNLISYGDLNMIYGPSTGSISSHLNLPRNRIYVPAEKNFQIDIQSYTTFKGESIHETLIIPDYNEISLVPGESVEIDLRSLVLPQRIEELKEETLGVEVLLRDKEEQGFFLAVERQQLSRIKLTTNAAESLLLQSKYDEAFTKSREAFVFLSDTETGLTSMLIDAARSVYILVGFIGLTSLIVSSLLYEENLTKILVSVVVFSVLLVTLYYLHPGAQIANRQELLQVAAISIIAVNLLSIGLPRFLNRSSSGTEVSKINMIVPLFSISKRSLRRRKLRFALTLTSILLLVASFISLTSFTTGYGLSFSKVEDSVQKHGVMIRTPDPPPERDAAPFSGGQGVSGPIPLDESLIDWYMQMEEVVDVVPRYDNQPQRQYRESNTPIVRIGIIPVFGIVGIRPQLEAKINHIDTAIIKGRYLEDSAGEVLISTGMAKKLGATVGDSFTIPVQEKIHELTIVGLLDEDLLTELTDIDGKPLLPNKIIEWARIEYDGPDYVVEALAPCSPDEVIWVNLKTGENMTALQLLRLNIILEEDADILEFARATALNRGFRAWASTTTGVFLAQLNEYFEGKGLPIVIPWLIVVLNVVVTMMNAYYERRHEVMIYSSIGMNPRHISSIFLAEAAVIGVVGGCLGYLIGLGAYKFIYILTPALQVKQKVSAIWSLAAIGISLMAVIIGGLSALLNSTAITPSLRRHWTIDKKQESNKETLIVIPVQVYEEEVEDYIKFLNMELDYARTGRAMMVKMLKMSQSAENRWEFSFIYCSSSAQISALYTRNRLIVEKPQGKNYTTTLFTIGESDSVKQAGSFLRQIGLDWSLQREQGVQ